MSRALQINSSPQGWMARNTKPVPLEEKGWVITMKKISIILLSAVLVFSMAACNGDKEKADNQTEKQTEKVTGQSISSRLPISCVMSMVFPL